MTNYQYAYPFSVTQTFLAYSTFYHLFIQPSLHWLATNPIHGPDLRLVYSLTPAKNVVHLINMLLGVPTTSNSTHFTLSICYNRHYSSNSTHFTGSRHQQLSLDGREWVVASATKRALVYSVISNTASSHELTSCLYLPPHCVGNDFGVVTHEIAGNSLHSSHFKCKLHRNSTLTIWQSIFILQQAFTFFR